MLCRWHASLLSLTLHFSFAHCLICSVLFTGTLRFNLDPFNRHTDGEIWDAIDKSHLRGMMDRLPDKLDHKVAEGGDNFSGQIEHADNAHMRSSTCFILSLYFASCHLFLLLLVLQLARSHSCVWLAPCCVPPRSCCSTKRRLHWIRSALARSIDCAMKRRAAIWLILFAHSLCFAAAFPCSLVSFR